MNERLKELRKSLGLTMEEFGKRLGVTKAAISRLENGDRNVTEQMIVSICREFNINEEWLRNGTEPMYLPKSAKLSSYVSEIVTGNDDFIKDLIEVYMELDQTSKDALKKIANNMAEKIKGRG